MLKRNDKGSWENIWGEQSKHIKIIPSWLRINLPTNRFDLHMKIKSNIFQLKEGGKILNTEKLERQRWMGRSAQYFTLANQQFIGKRVAGLNLKWREVTRLQRAKIEPAFVGSIWSNGLTWPKLSFSKADLEVVLKNKLK